MISLRKSLRLLSSGSSRGVLAERWFSVSSRQQTEKSYPPNNSLQIKMIHNRNPRNLEKLRIGDKPVGYNLDLPGHIYWNKLVLEFSGKHVTVKIEHFTGMVPVKVSTSEWCIQKQLFGTKDMTAVETVGRVLAERCLQAGIVEVTNFFTEEDLSKEKIQLFIKACEDGGLTLQEPDQLHREEIVHLTFPQLEEKAWEVFEEIDEKFLKKIENKTLPSSSKVKI